MRKIILFFVLSFGMVSAALAGDRPEVARYVKAYSGGEGIVVRVLRFGPQANQEALVQISGIDHKWDFRIHKATIEPMQRGIKYFTTVNGTRHDLIKKDDSVELSVPGIGRTMVSYDKALSEQGNPEHFLTAFLEQK